MNIDVQTHRNYYVDSRQNYLAVKPKLLKSRGYETYKTKKERKEESKEVAGDEQTEKKKVPVPWLLM